MKAISRRSFAILAPLAIAVVFVLSKCSYYVWPPDVITGRKIRLCSAHSKAGDRFEVSQYWNYEDFYTTELLHIRPDGREHKDVVDSDDNKEWSCSARVLENEKLLLLAFSAKNTVVAYRWDTDRFIWDNQGNSLIIKDHFAAANGSFGLRVISYEETREGMPDDTYYMFESALPHSNKFHEFMGVRANEPKPLPEKHLRFVDDHVGYVFFGCDYAVSTNQGVSWSRFNLERDVPDRQIRSSEILEIDLHSSGNGTMTLNVVGENSPREIQLHTTDFGRSWK